LIALVFAMSGTDYAATGGDFILGKANTASSVTSLPIRRAPRAAKKGTALSLSSSSTTPPLNVSNSVQMPNLNASEIGGTPASGFIQGGGAVSDGRQTLSSVNAADLVSASGSRIHVECLTDENPIDQLHLLDLSGSNELVTWWIGGGGAGQTTLNSSSYSALLDGSTGTNVVLLQVDTGSNISTYTPTENYHPTTNTCTFTGEVVNANG
jgi:hypothetical protein